MNAIVVIPYFSNFFQKCICQKFITSNSFGLLVHIVQRTQGRLQTVTLHRLLLAKDITSLVSQFQVHSQLGAVSKITILLTYFFFLLQLTLSLKQAGILVFVTEIPESSSSPPLGIMSVILICNSREHFHIINCFPVSSSSAVGGQQNKPSHHQVTDLSGEQCYPT